MAPKNGERRFVPDMTFLPNNEIWTEIYIHVLCIYMTKKNREHRFVPDMTFLATTKL